VTVLYGEEELERDLAMTLLCAGGEHNCTTL